MKARIRRARAWKPTFPQEVILTWGLTLIAALMVGATTTAAITNAWSAHVHHASGRVQERPEAR